MEKPKSRVVSMKIDKGAPAIYANIVNVVGTPEEIVLDFALDLRAFEPGEVVLETLARVTLSPYASKRLLVALQKTIEFYEATYGELKLDPIERAKRDESKNL